MVSLSGGGPDAQGRPSGPFFHVGLRGRPTEIDHLQGAVVRLARKLNLNAPLSERIIALVRQAEASQSGSPMLRPDDVRL